MNSTSFSKSVNYNIKNTITLHSKNRCFTEPLKRVPEMSKVSKDFQSLKKTDTKIYETLKGFDGGHKGQTMLYESLI